MAEPLEFVDILVTTVVTSARQALRVLVSENGPDSLHGGQAGQVLHETECQRIGHDRGEVWKTHLRRDKLEPTKLAPCFLVDDILDNRIYLC